MLTQQRLGIAALVVLAIFAGAASAQEGTKLRYQFREGDDLQYVIDQKMKMTMTIAGMDLETRMNMTLQLSWTVLNTDKDGNAKIRLRVTHAKLSMEGATGSVSVDSNDKEPPKDELGKIMHGVIKTTGSMEMTCSLLPTGVMTDGKMSETTLKSLKELPDKAGDMLSPESFKTMINSVVLPADAVTKGKTWMNKTEAKTPFGKTNTENTYTYDGVDKAKLEKISVKPKITVDTNPDAPEKVQIKAAKGTGTVLFDNKAGRVAEMTTQQTMQMSLSANNMEIEQTIEQTTTLKLKKK